MTSNFLNIFLQAAPAGQGGFPMGAVMMVGMVVVMYFFMIRPQQKKAKEQKKFAESMNTGDKIISTAGIHGTITRVNDDGTIQVEVSRGNFMTLERSAISMEMTAANKRKQKRQ